jgi:hypothetical protein
MTPDTAAGQWQRYGDVEITSGRLLLADPADLPDLLPQIASADLREIAQVVPIADNGIYRVMVQREGGVITAVRMDLTRHADPT